MELAKELKELTSKELDQEMMESIKYKLMRARDNAGLTQEKLAELSGIQANSAYLAGQIIGGQQKYQKSINPKITGYFFLNQSMRKSQVS